MGRAEEVRLTGAVIDAADDGPRGWKSEIRSGGEGGGVGGSGDLLDDGEQCRVLVREGGMPQEPNPVVLKQVKEISCLPVNTRACSSTRHYTTHSYPQQCGGVSAVRDGVALQRRSSRTGETDLPFLSSAVRLPRGPLPTLPGQGVSQG